MNNIFIPVLFCLCLIICACNESLDDYKTILEADIVPFVPYTECNKDLSPITFRFDYCPSSSNDDCEIIDKDTLYGLDKDLFALFPNFCMNAPERLYFKNLNGNYQAFEVVEKLWFYNKNLEDKECVLGITNCNLYEKARIRFKSLNQTHHISIEFSTQPDKFEINQLADLVILDRSSTRDDNTKEQIFLSALVEPFLLPSETKFYFDFMINEENYTAVIEGPLWEASSSIKKIFYSLDLGLVGFLDQDDILWNLVS